MITLNEGDIVKLSSEGTEKLGLIKQVEADTILIGDNWYELNDYKVDVLHSEG